MASRGNSRWLALWFAIGFLVPWWQWRQIPANSRSIRIPDRWQVALPFKSDGVPLPVNFGIEVWISAFDLDPCAAMQECGDVKVTR